MKMKLKVISQEIIDQYQLQDLQENGWVYMKIVKDVPGLKQATRLANEILVHHLAPYVYAPVQHTPSLWKHESNGILFSLVVDDLGIKFTSQAATSHLIQALWDKYQITVDPSGTKFLGFVLDWDYPAIKSNRQCQIISSMLSVDSSIPCLFVFNMPHIATTNQHMSKRSNLPTHRMTPKKFSSQPHPKPSFSKFLEFFSIMESLWTSPC